MLCKQFKSVIAKRPELILWHLDPSLSEFRWHSDCSSATSDLPFFLAAVCTLPWALNCHCSSPGVMMSPHILMFRETMETCRPFSYPITLDSKGLVWYSALTVRAWYKGMLIKFSEFQPSNVEYEDPRHWFYTSQDRHNVNVYLSLNCTSIMIWQEAPSYHRYSGTQDDEGPMSPRFHSVKVGKRESAKLHAGT